MRISDWSSDVCSSELMVPGVFLHVVGAETLKRGTPVDIGWAPAFALAIATLLLTLTTRLQRWFTAIAIATALLLITTKVVLAGMLVTSSIGTAPCLIAAISANVSRKRRRASENGRAHVCTPVTNAHTVCRFP